MITLMDRVDGSNKETLIVNKGLIDLKGHLTMNKVLIPVKKDSFGKKMGFFKTYNGTLQLHICIPRENEIKEWHRFFIVDASKEEISRNKRLNIYNDARPY